MNTCIVLEVWFSNFKSQSVSRGLLGVQHSRFLVHGALGKRCSVQEMVHARQAQSFLDNWILQSPRISHCHETGLRALYILHQLSLSDVLLLHLRSFDSETGNCLYHFYWHSHFEAFSVYFIGKHNWKMEVMKYICGKYITLRFKL